MMERVWLQATAPVTADTISTTAKVEAVSGLVYHTGDGVQQVEYKEVAMGEMELKGGVEVEIGMRASIKAEVFDGKAKATLGMEGGIAIGGEAKAFTAPLPDTAEYHACDLCVDGECHGYFEVEIAAKFEICDWLKGDILDLDLVRVLTISCLLDGRKDHPLLF